MKDEPLFKEEEEAQLPEEDEPLDAEPLIISEDIDDRPYQIIHLV